MAYITDEEGNIIYLIKATMWTKAAIVLFTILITIAVLLTALVSYNTWRLNKLETEIEQIN